MFKRKRRENSEICRLTEEERLAKIRELEAKRDGVISELEELIMGKAPKELDTPELSATLSRTVYGMTSGEFVAQINSL